VIRLFEAFAIPAPGGGTRMTYHTAADDRLRAVKLCTNLPLLHEALQAEHLQKSVRIAIERRIRKLERGP